MGNQRGPSAKNIIQRHNEIVMAVFFSDEEAAKLATQKWFQNLSPTILITGIDSLESALNKKVHYAGALAARDHASTILCHLYMGQWQVDQEWEIPEIVVEFREKMDKKNLIGITNSNGDVCLPAIWIHLGHGGYEYPIIEANMSLGHEEDSGWVDTKEILNFIENCELGHLLLAVLPICKSKYSKDILSKSDKVSYVVGDDEEDINSSKVEDYLNNLRDLCSEAHKAFLACALQAVKNHSSEIEE